MEERSFTATTSVYRRDKNPVKVNTYVKGLAAAVLLFIVPLEIVTRQSLQGPENSWIATLQSDMSSEQVKSFFKTVTLLGNRWVYLGISPFLIHLFDPKDGLKIIVVTGFGMYFESVLSLVYCEPRPYWVRDDISGMDCISGFGNPTADLTLTSVLLIYLLIQYIHKTEPLLKATAYTLVVFLTLLQAFSKVYVGDNYPHQVVITLCYVFIYLTAALAVDVSVSKIISKSTFNYQANRHLVMYWFVGTLLLLLVVVSVYDIITLNRNTNIVWIKNANLHCTLPNGLGQSQSFDNSAYIFYNYGVISGCMYISKFRFSRWWKTAYWKRVLRALLALGISIALYFMFQAIPMSDNTCQYVFRFALFNFLAAYLGTAGISIIGLKIPLFNEEDRIEEGNAQQLVPI